MKKRAATPLMLAALMLASGLPVHAEKATGTVNVQPASISSEMAVKIARERLGGLPGYEQKAEVNAAENERNREQSFIITFRKLIANKGYESVTVEIGKQSAGLLKYRHEVPENPQESSRPTDAVAQQAAESFLARATPELTGRLHLQRIAWSRTYADGPSGAVQATHAVVLYEELVNGIPFPSNVVTVEVDEKGDVVQMARSFHFDSSKLPPAFLAIKPEQAESAFLQEFLLRKSYMTHTMQRDDDGAYHPVASISLGYHPLSAPVIDALTGKAVSDDPVWYTYHQYAEPKSQKMTGAGRTLTPKSKADVPRMVGELVGVDLSAWEGGEIQGPYRAEQENVTWQWYEKSSSKVVIASCDPDDNSIVSVSLVDDVGQAAGQPAFTVEEGAEKARALLQPYLPLGERDVFLTHAIDFSKHQTAPEWFDPARTQLLSVENVYTYGFAIGYQGVPVRDQYYTVRISAATGKLMGLNLSDPADVPLPDDRNTLTTEQAARAYLRDNKLQLRYDWPTYAGQEAPYGFLRYEVVRDVESSYYIDAFTGKTVEFYP